MWVLKWVFIAIILFILIGFSLQNTQESMITVFRYDTGPIPLYLIVFIAFTLGFAFCLILAIYHQFVSSAKLRKCRKEIRWLNDELERVKAEKSSVDEIEKEEEIEETATEDEIEESSDEQEENDQTNS